MSAIWFECKVKYETIDEESGKDKTVTVPYLLDAMSFTEAETRITEQMRAYVSGEFNVTAMKICNFTDVLFFEGDKWYEAKVKFSTCDDVLGKTKTVTNTMMLRANSVSEANTNITTALKDIMVDSEVVGLKETPIMDVFIYVPETTES